jgi:hypothetical protein
MNRKASVEIQFNWVMTLIIGALILSFFGTIVFYMKNMGESKVTHEILSKMDTKLTGAYYSKNYVDQIRINSQNFEIKFAYPDYIVNNQRQSLGGKLIFAPSSLSGNIFMTWTQTWNIGFDVVNFMYFSNPSIKYYIVADSSYGTFAKEVNSSIKKRYNESSRESLIRMDYYDSLPGANEGYEKVRVIYFGSGTPPFPSFIPSTKSFKDVTALKVVGDMKRGELTFYKKEPNTASFKQEPGESYYVGKELLYGAIFVDDKKSYDYLAEKAMKRLQLISYFYAKVSDGLNHEIPSCPTSYPDTIFSDISNAAKTFTIAQSQSTTDMADEISTIEGIKQQIEYAHCTLIY